MKNITLKSNNRKTSISRKMIKDAVKKVNCKHTHLEIETIYRKCKCCGEIIPISMVESAMWREIEEFYKEA